MAIAQSRVTTDRTDEQKEDRERGLVMAAKGMVRERVRTSRRRERNHGMMQEQRVYTKTVRNPRELPAARKRE